VGAATPQSVSDLATAAPDAPPPETQHSLREHRDIEAARSGDHAAFARLYDGHAAVVLSLCRRFAGPGPRSEVEAEDALQETFIRAYRLLDTLDDPRRLRSWLFGIARRVCAERRRSGMRRARHEANAMTVMPPHADAPAAADGCLRSEALSRLDAALEALPDDERLAVHLYYLDPDPIRAASESLGLSRSGFYKLLARAREHLARLMPEANTP